MPYPALPRPRFDPWKAPCPGVSENGRSLELDTARSCWAHSMARTEYQGSFAMGAVLTGDVRASSPPSPAGTQEVM